MTELIGASGAAYRLRDGEPVVGGEALVYAALAVDDAHPVAIKVAREPGEHGAWLRAEFDRLTALGRHPRVGPHVVPVWDHGLWEDRPFLVLEWLPNTLANWLPARSASERLDAARALVAAIRDLHEAGVVHGDLKPANVLVRTDGGSLVLTDLVVEGRARGRLFTGGYACPEQIAGQPPDPAWDRFGLAVTVWWAIAGVAPTAPLLPLQAGPKVRRAISAGEAVDPERAFARLGLIAATAEDRIRFDRAAPGRTELRSALERLLEPSAARRERSLAPLAAALDAPARAPRRRAGGVFTGVALVGALLGMRQGEPVDPACPAGYVREGSACVGPHGQRVVFVPPGRFEMGRGSLEPPHAGDATPHPVTITAPFWMDAHEVTQAEWRALFGSDPARTLEFTIGDNRFRCDDWWGASLVGDALPAVCIAWEDAVMFANERSLRDGLRPAYTIRWPEEGGMDVTWDRAADGWRLPTEAEWEWAARGGQDQPWAGAPGRDALCAYANLRDASALEKWTGELPCDDGAPAAAPVGSYRPNAWGLHDMLGNALEWVWDRYAPYPEHAAVDPTGPDDGVARVYRGGSWNHVAKGSAMRYATEPGDFNFVIGVRYVRGASEAASSTVSSGPSLSTTTP